jgi:hypothetical protein
MGFGRERTYSPPPHSVRAPLRQRAALAAWRIPAWADTTSWPRSPEGPLFAHHRSAWGYWSGALPQAYWAAGVAVNRACAPRAGANTRGDLVQAPVKLPVLAEVVLAVKPLARP